MIRCQQSVSVSIQARHYSLLLARLVVVGVFAVAALTDHLAIVLLRIHLALDVGLNVLREWSASVQLPAGGLVRHRTGKHIRLTMPMSIT